MKVIPFIKRNKYCYCGYVAIPPENICFGYDEMKKFAPPLSVYGGVTFSEPVIIGEYLFELKTKKSYVGKRQPQLDNCEYLTDNREVPDDWWIIGFDTCHIGDVPFSWTKEAVIAETMRLAEQLEKYNQMQ